VLNKYLSQAALLFVAHNVGILP